MSLHAAAKRGDLDELKELVLHVKMDMEERDGFAGMTALHYAAKHGHSEAVKHLCAWGADVDAQSSTKWTPVALASYHGHTDCVAALLAHHSNAELAAEWNVKPVFRACQRGHEGAMALLLKAKVSINDAEENTGYSCLHAACENGHLQIVRRLLGAGAQLNASNKFLVTPLYLAAKNAHMDIVTSLIRLGASLHCVDSRDGRQTLHWSAYHGDSQVISLLCSSGASVDVADLNGLTPLHLAAEQNQLAATRTLLRLGADQQLLDKAGRVASGMTTNPAVLACFETKHENARVEELQKRRLNLQAQRKQRREEERQAQEDLRKQQEEDREAELMRQRRRRRVEREEKERAAAEALKKAKEDAALLILRVYRKFVRLREAKRRAEERERRLRVAQAKREQQRLQAVEEAKKKQIAEKSAGSL